MEVTQQARQLAYMGDVDGAVALLQESLQEDGNRPRLWQLLGELLSTVPKRHAGSSSSSFLAFNPSGLSRSNLLGGDEEEQGRRPCVEEGSTAPSKQRLEAAAEAFGQAVNLAKRSGQTDLEIAGRDCLQQLLRREIGFSPSVVLEGCWDADRSRFITNEARSTCSRLRAVVGKGRLVACLVDCLGWESVWLARHAATLGLESVISLRSPRTSILASFEKRLADCNEASKALIQSSWEDIDGHLSMTRPDGLLLFLGDCFTPYPSQPSLVCSQVKRLVAVAKQTGFGSLACSCIPRTLHYVGGPASGPLLRSFSVVDAGNFQEFGLDYSRAQKVLRPSHMQIILSEGDVKYESKSLAVLDLDGLWQKCLSASDDGHVRMTTLTWQDVTQSLPFDVRKSDEIDAMVWWTESEGHCDEAIGSSQRVGCAPSNTRRTWQVAVFGEGIEARPLEELLTAPSLPTHFRSYHVSMLNDVLRTKHYAAAVQQALKDWDSSVPVRALDIGAGTGLLSMLLAQEALKRLPSRESVKVVAIEAEQVLADIARDLIEDNGLSDVIEVRNVLSTSLTSSSCFRTSSNCGGGGDGEEEFLGRGNVCIHEVFGSDPLSERMLPSLRHALGQLLEGPDESPDGQTGCAVLPLLIPSKFKLHCCLCSATALEHSILPPSSLEGLRSVREAFDGLTPAVEARFLRGIGQPSSERSKEDFVWLCDEATITLDLHRLPSEAPLKHCLELRGGGADGTRSRFEAVFAACWFSIDGIQPLDTLEVLDGSRPWAPFYQRLSMHGGSGIDLLLGPSPFVAKLEVHLQQDRVRCSLASVSLQDERAPEGLASLFDDL